jgi:hypothetical protein
MAEQNKSMGRSAHYLFRTYRGPRNQGAIAGAESREPTSSLQRITGCHSVALLSPEIGRASGSRRFPLRGKLQQDNPQHALEESKTHHADSER